MITSGKLKGGGRTAVKNKQDKKFDERLLTREQIFPLEQHLWKYILVSQASLSLSLLLSWDWEAQVYARHLLQPKLPTCQRSPLSSIPSPWFSRCLTCGLLGNSYQASEQFTADWPRFQPLSVSYKWAVILLPESRVGLRLGANDGIKYSTRLVPPKKI